MDTTCSTSRLPGDVLVGGAAALLQGFGILLFFTLAVGGLLTALLSTMGTAEFHAAPCFLYTVLGVALVLGGPFFIGIYLGASPWRSLLMSAVASLAGGVLSVLIALVIEVAGDRLVSRTIQPSIIVLTLPLYVIVVSGSMRTRQVRSGRRSWASILGGCALVMATVADLEAARCWLGCWVSGAVQPLTLKTGWILGLIYGTAAGMAVPILIALISGMAGSVWVYVGLLLLGAVGVLAVAVSVTVTVGLA